MGFQIEYISVRQQTRKSVDDGLAILFTDTDIDCHVFPLKVIEFIQQVHDHSSKPVATPQPGMPQTLRQIALGAPLDSLI
jgi:hypothetical protein